MSVYVLAFESTHAAMAAGKTLASGSVDYQTIPVPTSITAGCGIALRFEMDDPEPVLARVFGSNRSTGLAALHRESAPRTYELVCEL